MTDTAGHVVVIGAGAIGTISAIELRRRGRRVTLLDPGPPGGEQSASFGNAGWLTGQSIIPPAMPGMWKQVPRLLTEKQGAFKLDWRYFPKAAPWLIRYLLSGSTVEKVSATAAALRFLLRQAPELHGRLAREAGVPELVEHKGVLHVYASEQAFRSDALAWEIRRNCGISWQELQGDALAALEPALARSLGFAVLVEEAGRCLDPGAYVAALARHFQAMGGEIRRASLRGFNLTEGRLTAVETDAGPIACDQAVLAAGIHSGKFAATLGDRLPLEAERGYHVMLHQPHPRLNRGMMLGGSKIVIGPMRQGLRAAGQVEIAALGTPPDWRRADIIEAALRRAVPDPGPGEVTRWMGSRPSFPDGLPCIDFASQSRDIAYAFGHGHVGLVGSARTGSLVAQMLLGETTDIPLTPYRSSRFR